ncbi:TolC family protein [Luteimonas sp. e5]
MIRAGMLALALMLATPFARADAWLPPAEAVERAINAQPQVAAARSRLQLAQAQAAAREAGPHEWRLQGIAQQRRMDEAGFAQRYREYEMQINRGLRLPGKAALDREIGMHGIEAAQLRLDDARHAAARLLLQRWMDWLRAAGEADAARLQGDSYARERQAMQRRVQLGDAALKDLELLDVELAQAQAATVSAQGAAVNARAALARDFPELPLPQTPPPLPEPQALPGTAQEWIGLIEGRSHEIGAARADARQADALAARARAERRADPSFGLRWISDRDGVEKALGLVVELPLGGRHRAALADAEAANAAALHAEALGIVRQTRQEAELAVHQAEVSRAHWQAQREALEASTRASQRIHRGWQLGELALADWLLAERTRAAIALAETQARIAAEEARLRVLVDSHELWHAHD